MMSAKKQETRASPGTHQREGVGFPFFPARRRPGVSDGRLADSVSPRMATRHAKTGQSRARQGAGRWHARTRLIRADRLRARGLTPAALLASEKRHYTAADE